MARFIVKAFTFLILATSLFAQAQQEFIAMKTRQHPYPVVRMKEGKDLSDSLKGIQHLTSEQREQARLVIKEGVVYDRTGKVVADTKNETSGHEDKINYVMDGNGNLYLFDEYTYPKVRHSSIFSGGPVAGAGEISIKGGRITYIDADSGHYSTKKQMRYVVQELQESGVDLKSVEVED